MEKKRAYYKRPTLGSTCEGSDCKSRQCWARQIEDIVMVDSILQLPLGLCIIPSAGLTLQNFVGHLAIDHRHSGVLQHVRSEQP